MESHTIMQFATIYTKSTEFNITSGDLSSLEIRVASADNPALHYFYDTLSNRLITDFILEDRQKVATLCQVTLIKGNDGFSPRIRLWKKDKTCRPHQTLEHTVTETEITKVIKATVDTDSCQDSFWKLINWLKDVRGVVTSEDTFRLVPGDSTKLVQSLQLENKEVVLEAIQKALGGSLTERDINLLTNRKLELDTFKRLINDEAFFEAERLKRRQKDGTPAKAESIWQRFFEKNPWIFGYGLSLVACDGLDDEKLEQVTQGASKFGGAGKRVDALMRSKGYISSLLFCEIKTHQTPLLTTSAYRPPDVYSPSGHLIGAVSQVQKTTEKTVRSITQSLKSIAHPDGSPTGLQVSSIKPKQVVVIGNLNQLSNNSGINEEKLMSFELFRNSLQGIEVLTFDELLARARFIVQDP